MAKSFSYHLTPDPDGQGWIISAEGYVPHSLPYDTLAQAIEVVEQLVCQHPGSSIYVDSRPPALTPVEIEHRVAA